MIKTDHNFEKYGWGWMKCINPVCEQTCPGLYVGLDDFCKLAEELWACDGKELSVCGPEPAGRQYRCK